VLDGLPFRRVFAVRDIREDLRERLAAIQSAYNKTVAEHDAEMVTLQTSFRHKADALERERIAVLQLLKIEEERPESEKDERGGIPKVRQPTFPMAEFIITKLHAHGPMTKEEIRTQVDLAGYLDGEATGRTFHLTLMNISSGGGRVGRLPDGRYAFQPKGSQATLFASVQAGKGDVSPVLM
jgi:hypothetical protein